jgi:hypothetical protein
MLYPKLHMVAFISPLKKEEFPLPILNAARTFEPLGAEKEYPLCPKWLKKIPRAGLYQHNRRLPNKFLFMQNPDNHIDKGFYLIYQASFILCF